MAYNRRNFLKRVLKIQEITLLHRKKEMYFKNIYHTYIAEQFGISQRTYENYLGINARKELKELEQKQTLKT